jgi:hypothetical protein
MKELNPLTLKMVWDLEFLYGNTFKDKKHRFVPSAIGTIYRKEKGECAYSYREIKPQMDLNDPDDPMITYTAEIRDNSVFLNDRLIATAPSNKPKPQRERFCKAVVWALKYDPVSLKDKINEVLPFSVRIKLSSGYIPYLNLAIREVATA